MSDAPQFLQVGSGPQARQIAVRKSPGRRPAIVWLGGFRSDMLSTKAGALAQAAEAAGFAMVRFDYSGHGESGGRFRDGTISLWLEESLAVIGQAGPEPSILVGSSMGGWLAVLAARRLAALGSPPAGLVLIAPAIDFTETLMWQAFPPAVRSQLLEEGLWLRPSAYSPEPYPITLALIEDGRSHLIGSTHLRLGAPVRVLQGALDPDVPLGHVLGFVEHLAEDEVTLSIVPDGDHRLSRPEDIALLTRTVLDLAEDAAGGTRTG